MLVYVLMMISKNCIGQNQNNELLVNSVTPFDSMGRITDEFKLKLKESLKNVRVLALGESQHNDGLTFKHKTMLVKYLHDKMGYNVLAFEFGFYGNWRTNENLKKGMDVKEATKYSGWARSKFAFPVYEFISQTHKTGTSLNYAGFDKEKVPDGIPNIKNFLNEIIQLTNFSVKETDRLLLDSFVLAVYGQLGNPHKDALKFNRRRIAIDIISKLSDMVALNRKQFMAKLGEKKYMIYKFTLESILMDEKDTYGGTFKNIIRDKNMANRVKWLIDSLYKGEKIILWGASAHFARNMISIDRRESDYELYPYYQMGDWLHSYYGNSFYSIAFTSGSGRTGLILPENHRYKKFEQIYNIPSPHVESFENVAYLTGKSALFCDIRNTNKDSWLNSKFISYSLGYNQDFTRWNSVLDGIYFIKEMQPNEWKSN